VLSHIVTQALLLLLPLLLSQAPSADLPAEAAALLSPASPGGAPAAAFAVWTTTPWTIPANLAVAVNGDLDYAIVQAEVGGMCVLLCDVLHPTHVLCDTHQPDSLEIFWGLIRRNSCTVCCALCCCSSPPPPTHTLTLCALYVFPCAGRCCSRLGSPATGGSSSAGRTAGGKAGRYIQGMTCFVLLGI
jgi:tRNA synthetases class I (I, L, M and V)